MAYKTPNATCKYIRELMGQEDDPLLLDIMKEAELEKIPILLPEAAAFVKQMVMLQKPQRVLEIGTAIGYSGCIFLKNCDCKLITLEKNPLFAQRAKHNFHRFGFDGRYQIIEGDAAQTLASLNDKYDLIFLDGPKAQYINYLKEIMRLLASGGVLLADNVLFNGMVAGGTETHINPNNVIGSSSHQEYCNSQFGADLSNIHVTHDKKNSIAKKLDLFLRELYNDKRLFTSVLNVGDGMSLSIRL